MSRKAFAQFILELDTSPAAITSVDADAKQMSEVVNIKRSIKPVRELYGGTLAAEFAQTPLPLRGST